MKSFLMYLSLFTFGVYLSFSAKAELLTTDLFVKGWPMTTASEVKAQARTIFGTLSYNNWGHASGTASSGVTVWIGHFRTSAGKISGLHSVDDGNIWLTGTDDRNLYNDYNDTTGRTHAKAGVHLAYDGEIALSSLVDPAIKVNNLDTPINDTANTDTQANIPLLILALILLGYRKALKNGAVFQI